MPKVPYNRILLIPVSSRIEKRELTILPDRTKLNGDLSAPSLALPAHDPCIRQSTTRNNDLMKKIFCRDSQTYYLLNQPCGNSPFSGTKIIEPPCSFFGAWMVGRKSTHDRRYAASGKASITPKRPDQHNGRLLLFLSQPNITRGTTHPSHPLRRASASVVLSKAGVSFILSAVYLAVRSFP